MVPVMAKPVLVCLILSCFCGPPALGLLGVPVATDSPRLVVFAPWQDGVALVQQAGGQPVGPLRAPMGILAYAPDTPGFDTRLRQQGAWAIVNGDVLAQLCGLDTAPQTQGFSS
jgi:hypothetical protein